MTTYYEWDIETCFLNEDGEIEIHDHDHRDRINEWPTETVINAINQDQVPSVFTDTGVYCFTRLVLVRDSERDPRAWAYITEDGKLPDEMLDAYDRLVCAVPKRYREEFDGPRPRRVINPRTGKSPTRDEIAARFEGDRK